MVEFNVAAEYAGVRLDKYLSLMLSDYSRVFLQKLIKTGSVTVDSQPCSVPKTPVVAESVITVELPEEQKQELVGEKIDLPILFEDDSILVINKPPGIVVHPGAGNWSGTIVNALIGRDKDFADTLSSDDMRPGIVHRLDKDTSGCLVVAKSRSSHFKLSESFAKREVRKIYTALTYGCPQQDSGNIMNHIARHPVNRKKMAVSIRNGKLAITSYSVEARGTIDKCPVALVKVQIRTGRTHQIRVHMAELKSPVLGDAVYGGNQALSMPHQMLHAGELAFPHPETGKNVSFSAPYPDDFADVLKRLVTLTP